MLVVLANIDADFRKPCVLNGFVQNSAKTIKVLVSSPQTDWNSANNIKVIVANTANGSSVFHAFR